MTAVRLRGEGRVEVIAHGLEDAEQVVEKEMRALWPGARIVIRGARRNAEEPWLVDGFLLTYRLEASVEAEGEDDTARRRAAFRIARERLRGSRFRNTSWQAVGGDTFTP